MSSLPNVGDLNEEIVDTELTNLFRFDSAGDSEDSSGALTSENLAVFPCYKETRYFAVTVLSPKYIEINFPQLTKIQKLRNFVSKK